MLRDAGEDQREHAIEKVSREAGIFRPDSTSVPLILWQELISCS